METIPLDARTREPEVAPSVADDAELIRRIQAEDLDAFEVLFARHRGLIQRTALGLTGDPQAAEEVLQDTFVRAYRHRASLRLDVSPVPWLYRVALNLCYTRLGRRRLPSDPISETASELADDAPQPPEVAEREEMRRAIRRGISALPAKHQAVIDLYYLQGRTLQQTADTLDVRLGTVKSRIHYALHALRDHLAADTALDQAAAGARRAGAPERATDTGR